MVRPLSFLLSTIGNTAKKNLLADYNQIPLKCYRMTIKVRAMGTNTAIGIGDVNGQNFTLTSIGDSKTYIAPIIRGDTKPFELTDYWVLGNNAANDGVLEIDAIVE